jgi:hypothetical protein
MIEALTPTGCGARGASMIATDFPEFALTPAASTTRSACWPSLIVATTGSLRSIALRNASH